MEGDIVQTALYSADLVCVLDLLGAAFAFPSKVHGSPNGGQLELGHLLALANVLSQKVHITGGESTWKPVITFREHCEDRFTVPRLFLLRTF